MRIYLDHHASAPLSAAARDAMLEALAWIGANPSSPHAEGRRARDAVETAREALAGALACAPRELVFTSGGTEALHLALIGLGEAQAPTGVLCDPGAHPAMRAACEAVAARRGAPLRFLRARDGATVYDPDALMERDLVAISWVQHETGRVAAGAEALIGSANLIGATVVIDAAQALGKVPFSPRNSGAAAAVMSAHKIGGPQGVGALWLSPGQRAAPLLRGGGQERGLRAGTEPVLGAVGFGAAALELQARLDAQPRVSTQRDRVERALTAVDGVEPSAERGARVATVAHVAARGCDGAEMVAAFDLEGVSLSSRSACSSGRSEPSESLLRLFPDEPWRASCSLRVSLGPDTRDDEVARFEGLAASVIARVRRAHSKTKR